MGKGESCEAKIADRGEGRYFGFRNKADKHTGMQGPVWQTCPLAGEGVVFSMDNKSQQPVATLFHELINHLAAIVGHCDLLIEMTKDKEEYVTRLMLIRDIAEKSAKQLRQYQRELVSEARHRDRRKAG